MNESSSDFEGRVYPVGFPAPMRVEYAWKLFIEGKCVARSADYFPTENAARIALEEFMDKAPGADVVIDERAGKAPGKERA